ARAWVVAAMIASACDGRAAAPPAAPVAATPTAAASTTSTTSTSAAPSSAAPAPASLAPALPPEAQLVEYAPDRRGFLYRPEGAGPFPGVVWNHGSEKLPGWRPELGKFYTAHGWAFFVPHRRGHGRSKGDYIGNESDPAKMVAL